MPHTAYALGLRCPGGPPLLVWRFASGWLRDAAVRENPEVLRPVHLADVLPRVRRAERLGAWRDVAPGVRALLHDEPPPGEPFPALPKLKLPTPATGFIGNAPSGRRWL